MEDEENDMMPKRRKRRDKHKERESSRVRRTSSRNAVSEDTSAAATSYQPSKPLSLKIKLGQSPSSKTARVENDNSPANSSTINMEEDEEEPLVIDQWQGDSEEEGTLVIDEVAQPDQVMASDENESDEGEWLKALEDGEVNERGYLPKKRGLNTLTARQKALQGDGEGTEELVELPVARKTKEVTEEMLLKRSERNKRRKLLADKRKEKSKVETVHRLLHKSNKKKDKKPGPDAGLSIPMVTYKDTPDIITLSLPPGAEFPLRSQKLPSPPPKILCSVEGCNNLKRYSDSLTHRPLCSLECYKKLQTNNRLPQVTS